jgi:hypothetical protein
MGTYSSQNKSSPVSNTELEQETYNPTDDMSGGQKFLAGVGKGMVDVGRGVADFVYDAIPGNQWGEEALNQNILNSRELSAPLMDTGAGMAGNITGAIAASLPAMFIPGANTAAGATAIGAGMGALEATVGDESRLMNTGKGAVLGRGGHYLGGKLGEALDSKIVQKGVNKIQNIVKDRTIKKAMENGYVIPPTMSSPSAVNKTLEGLSGKISTAQQASIKNQQVTDNLSRRALGLSDDAPLTVETLKEIRSVAGQMYDKVKGLGRMATDDQYIDDLGKAVRQYHKVSKEFKTQTVKEIDDLIEDVGRGQLDADTAVELVKSLRYQASRNMKSIDNPAKAQLAKVQKSVSAAIEDQMERSLGGDMLNQFKSARKLIAKTYSVEDALNPATGHVRAGYLGKEMSKGEPLSGELKIIAEMAQFAPKAVQEQTSSFIGLSPLDYAVGFGTAGASGNPLMMASMLARPAARSTILSKPYQKLMTAPDYSSGGMNLMKSAIDSQYGRAGIDRLMPAIGLNAFPGDSLSAINNLPQKQ